MGFLLGICLVFWGCSAGGQWVAKIRVHAEVAEITRVVEECRKPEFLDLVAKLAGVPSDAIRSLTVDDLWRRQAVTLVQIEARTSEEDAAIHVVSGLEKAIDCRFPRSPLLEKRSIMVIDKEVVRAPLFKGKTWTFSCRSSSSDVSQKFERARTEELQRSEVKVGCVDMTEADARFWNHLQTNLRSRDFSAVNEFIAFGEKDIEFTVAPAREMFQAGEPVTVQATIRNVSSRELHLCWPEGTRLTAESYEKNDRLTDDYNISLTPERSKGMKTVAPGDSLSFTMRFPIERLGLHAAEFDLSNYEYTASDPSTGQFREGARGYVMKRATCLYRVEDTKAAGGSAPR